MLEWSSFFCLRCLQHGDSWHNNFVFHKARDVVKVAIVDWQVGDTFASMIRITGTHHTGVLLRVRSLRPVLPPLLLHDERLPARPQGPPVQTLPRHFRPNGGFALGSGRRRHSVTAPPRRLLPGDEKGRFRLTSSDNLDCNYLFVICAEHEDVPVVLRERRRPQAVRHR